MKFINGISEVADNYDNYIIDLWGVLHDGYAPYAGAVEALKNLKAKGKKIVLLSNAPRRVNKARAVLEKLGFTSDMYGLLLTSGEVTYHYVQKNLEKLGSKYIYIGPEKDQELLNGLDVKEVATAAEADFALATGFENFGSLFSEKQAQLDDALKHKLPLLVANPDKKVVKQTGEEYICAGLMGEFYTQEKGEVIYFGKPHRNAYVECLEYFGSKDAKKILCIGDSLHTDIAGANMLGAGSVFVAGGIHKRDVFGRDVFGRDVFGHDMFSNDTIDTDKLQKLMEAEKQTPKYVINEFRW